MGIQVGDNFDHKSKKPLDARTSYTTLALMKAVTDANINEGCLAYCAETDKYYKFLSTNSVDASTGKWREFSSGGGGASSLNDLSDVTISSAASGQVLKNNGSGWVNGTLAKGDVGLGSVANTGDSATPTSGGTTKFTTGGAYTLKQSIDKAYKSDDTTESAVADADYFPFYDTSVTTKKKTLWSNIKSLLKTYFDTLYVGTAGTGLTKSSTTMGIKEFSDGDMADIITPLPSSASKYMNYSAEEQVCGQWIDGKTIYQQTFSGTLTNTSAQGTETATTITMGVSVDTFVNIWGVAIASSGIAQILPTLRYQTGGSTSHIRLAGNSNSVSSNKNTVQIQNAWYTSGTNTYNVTVQYTKS